MDLIIINNERLKVILSFDDMKKRNISAKELDYKNVATKRFLWEILDEAKQTAGFDAEGGKLYVSVFPSTDGGCEMFITKLPDKETEEEKSSQKKRYHRKVITERNNKIREHPQGYNEKYIVLEFDNLCELCKRLCNTMPQLKTSLYSDPSGVYILFLLPYSENSPLSNTTIPEYVYEYGQIHNVTQKTIAYVMEYCNIIAENNAALIIANL